MARTKPKIRKVEGIDGDIWVRQLTTREYVEAKDFCIDLDKKTIEEQIAGLSKLCHLACCDEVGAPIFESPDEVLDEPFSVLEACVEVVLTFDHKGAEPPKP